MARGTRMRGWAEERELKSGKKAYYAFYRDAEGKKHSAHGPDGEKSAKTEREAETWALDAVAEIRRGTWVNPRKGKETFAQYYTRWRAARVMEVNTKLTYDNHYNVEFEETFGSTAVGSITQTMVQDWITKMRRKGTTPGTIKARVKHLSAILGAEYGASAVNDGLLKSNPCAKVQLPKVVQREVEVYSVSESDKVLLEISTWWRCIPLLASETGYRWGELMGLRVTDFADDFREIYLTNTMLEVTKAETGNGTPFMWKERPKNHRARRTAISDEATSMVKHLVKTRKLFPQDRLFSMPAGKSRYVHDMEEHMTTARRDAPWEDGWPVSRNFFRDSIWIPAHERSGVKPLRFHDLKGSHLTWMLAGGADLRTVQARGDHADIKTTERYLGMLRGAERQALDSLKRTQDAARGLSVVKDDETEAQ